MAGYRNAGCLYVILFEYGLYHPMRQKVQPLPSPLYCSDCPGMYTVNEQNRFFSNKTRLFVVGPVLLSPSISVNAKDNSNSSVKIEEKSLPMEANIKIFANRYAVLQTTSNLAYLRPKSEG
jgi:hypothetical protein